MCFPLLFSRESSLSQHQASPPGRDKYVGSKQLEPAAIFKVSSFIGFACWVFLALRVGLSRVYTPHAGLSGLFVTMRFPKVLLKHFMPHPLSSLLKAATAIPDLYFMMLSGSWISFYTK